MVSKYKYLITLATTLIAGAAGASTTIDFNTVRSTAPMLTIDGATFTAEGGGTLSAGFGDTPNDTPGIVARRDARYVPIRATIAGGTAAVSVDLGDFASDDDALFLRLYGVDDGLLAVATGFISASFDGMVTLSARAPGTAYAVFGSIGAGGESSVYGDNFTFGASAATVAEPATWALLIGGFGACGAALRRRRAVAASAA